MNLHKTCTHEDNAYNAFQYPWNSEIMTPEVQDSKRNSYSNIIFFETKLQLISN